MFRTVLAFSDEKMKIRVFDCLRRNGIGVRTVCRTPQKALSVLKEMGGGVLITEALFRGAKAGDYLPLCEAYLLVLTGEEMKESDRLQVLPLYCSEEEICEKVRELLQKDEERSLPKRKQRTPEEEALLKEAKAILMRRYGMNENEAHHFLQRRAMSTSVSLLKAAAEITERS